MKHCTELLIITQEEDVERGMNILLLLVDNAASLKELQKQAQNILEIVEHHGASPNMELRLNNIIDAINSNKPRIDIYNAIKHLGLILHRDIIDEKEENGMAYLIVKKFVLSFSKN